MKSKVQFRLWEDCDNDCSFCNIQKGRKSTTKEEKEMILFEVKTEIWQKDFFDRYGTIGFIGGELYTGELHIYKLWREIIKKIADSSVEQIWIGTNLLSPLPKDLQWTLANLPKEKVLVCTSWDYIGRFKEGREIIWKDNINKLKSLGHYTHVSFILSQEFVTAYCKDPSIFPMICDSYCPLLVEPYEDEYIRDPNFTHAMYREAVQHNVLTLPTRQQFLNFLSMSSFTKATWINFTDNTSHADNVRVFIDSKKMQFLNRWGKTRWILPCGHFIYNLGYSDSSKCMACDVENFYNLSSR
jgi:hypothetical protein